MLNREKLRTPALCWGSWISTGSATVAEIAALSGLDWLLIDLEHGCLTESSLLEILRAISGHNVATVVRVPTHEAGLIGRVLDWGAHAIMVPYVETAEQAAAIVGAMQYPPAGSRGYSSSTRACSYGFVNSDSVARLLLFAQIESAEGVRNAESIAEVEGVDVLFVGPADLRMSLSATPAAPSFEEALEKVVKAARSREKSAGILIKDRDQAESLRQQGFTKIAVGTDVSFLRACFGSIHKAVS
jgi:2-dehydro-3-deoxyglucarate aldolase/4-hydroxy-2-oxoheptanedioate aldolase